MNKQIRIAVAAAAALCLVIAAAAAGYYWLSSADEDAGALIGPAAGYDYQNFTYDKGLDANGHWTGVTALDYVTLPGDFAAIPRYQGAGSSLVNPTSLDNILGAMQSSPTEICTPAISTPSQVSGSIPSVVGMPEGLKRRRS